MSPNNDSYESYLPTNKDNDTEKKKKAKHDTSNNTTTYSTIEIN